jgi:hypothetical protein
MNYWILCVAAALCFGLVGCEIIRMPLPNPAITPSEPSLLEPTPVYSEFVEIDKRQVAPAHDPGTQQRVTSLLVYKPSPLPPPKEIEPAEITVSPLDEPLAIPANLPTKVPGPVAIHSGQSEWQQYLLSAEVRVVDRDIQDALNREHFIQRDIIADSQVPMKHNATAASTNGEVFPKRLNGSELSSDERIALGKILPARAILELSNIEIVTSALEIKCEAPAQQAIDYRLAVDGYAVPFEAYRESVSAWSELTSSFHLEPDEELAFFDPFEGSLWTLDQAWLGGAVSRADFIGDRTTTVIPDCEKCGRARHDQSTTDGPSESDYRELWKCAVCDDTRDVIFLDGFSDPSQASHQNTAVIGIRWLKPRTGCFPVLRVGTPQDTDKGSFSLQLSNPTRSELARSLHAYLFDDQAPDAWCWINSRDEGLLLWQSDLDWVSLKCPPGAEDEWTMPKTDSDGRQSFELIMQPSNRNIDVSVPVEIASVNMRLIDVESAEVLAAGTYKLSYQNLMDEKQTIPVYSYGADLAGWPLREEQQSQLRIAIRKRLSELMRP